MTSRKLTGVLAFLALMLTATGSTAAPTAYFKVGDDLKTSCEGSAAGRMAEALCAHLMVIESCAR